MVLRVRPITNEEGNHLRTSIRHSENLIEMKRAQVILGSAQGFTVQKIGIFSGRTDGYIRTLIHPFNADGVAMLKPRWNPGNRHKFSKETRGRLVVMATSRPRDFHLRFGQWSLRRLRDTAVARGIVESISLEWLRVICDEADITSSKNGTGYAHFLRSVRRKYPYGGRIYLIQDNLSTHTTPAAVAEARRLNFAFVPTPTNASHLNPIETHFRTIRRWAFTRTNYTDWGEAERALRLAMRRLNRVHCVTNSRPALRWWTRH